MPLEKCPREAPTSENCLQRIKLLFKKFQLYSRPDIIGWILRPCNLEECLTVRCC